MKTRLKKIKRKTSETDIDLELNIDGKGNYQISSGIQFFDHMLDSFARHGIFDLNLMVDGDVEVDDHHTVEDVGLALGQAYKEALKDKKGIKRVANSLVPMDEALALVVVDLSGRSYAVLDMNFKTDKVGDLSTENVPHFFESFAHAAQINLHARAEGENDHHQIEALFKALGRALKDASRIEHNTIPSTKGVL
ncbi:MAG: imidazoleglycerol-phosphate dehydratase HisB [Methanobacteriaceae archaeon]